MVIADAALLAVSIGLIYVLTKAIDKATGAGLIRSAWLRHLARFVVAFLAFSIYGVFSPGQAETSLGERVAATAGLAALSSAASFLIGSGKRKEQ